MHSFRVNWTPDAVRRVCATTLSGRPVQILGDAGTEASFPHYPAGEDVAINKLFSMRAFAPGDSRLLSAAQDAGVTLFSPSPDSLHTPVWLPNILEAYVNNKMVANRVCPVVKVMNRSDKVASIPFGTGLSPADTRLAGQASMVPELTWSVATRGTYAVEDQGLRSFIPVDSVTNADPPFEVRRRTATILASTMELMDEIEGAALLGTSGNYASGYSSTISSVTDRWNNDASDPADQVRTGVAKLLTNDGQTKVVVVLGRDVFRALQKHPKVLAAFYSRPSTASGPTTMTVTEKMLAELFEVDEVVVGKAKKNTANAGQTVSLSDVWSNFASAVVVNDSPSAEVPCGFAHRFRYRNTAMDVQFIPELLPGVRGGEHCKVTKSDDLFVTGAQMGFGWFSVLS